MVVIVDYGLGNLRSIKSKVERLGFKVEISSSPLQIANAEKLILPGVGHFKVGMENIESRGLRAPLDEAVLQRKRPILGICLGMQLLTQYSEEGDIEGLGWVSAATRRFSFSQNRELRIPHVGWNDLKINFDSPLLDRLPSDSRFYFTHSYFVSAEDSRVALATTYHGVEFVSAIQSENIYGTQFHPEKSHRTGLQLLENFLRLP